MVSWSQIDAIAQTLPEVDCLTEGRRTWSVRGKGIAWERPLRPKEIAELGDDIPSGDIIAFHVADESIKRALIADRPEAFFTIRHFDGYPAVLTIRTKLRVSEVRELLTDGWWLKAPPALRKLHPELQ
jgi:hypothetical protein